MFPLETRMTPGGGDSGNCGFTGGVPQPQPQPLPLPPPHNSQQLPTSQPIYETTPEHIQRASAPPYDLEPTEPELWGKLCVQEQQLDLRALSTINDVPEGYPQKGWDPEVWATRMINAKGCSGSGFCGDDPIIRGMRLLVGRSTQTALTLGHIHQVSHSMDNKALSHCCLIRPSGVCATLLGTVKELRENRGSHTNISLTDSDGLNTVRELARSTNPPQKVVYVLGGNTECMGGDWWKGGLSLEEDLFYRTNMSCMRYAYKGRSPVVFTDDVTLFRSSEDNGFSFLDYADQVQMTVVTIQVPDTHRRQGTEMSNEEIGFLQRNLEVAFSAAAHSGISKLVLTPFGCDHSACSPHVISSIIKTVTEKYTGFVSEVYVAVSHKFFSEDVYNEFKKTLIGTTGSGSTTKRLEKTCTYIPVIDAIKPCCRYAGMCMENPQLNKQHFAEFYHPAACPKGNACKDNEMLHHIILYHPNQAQVKSTTVVVVAAGATTTTTTNTTTPAAAAHPTHIVDQSSILPFCSDPFLCPHVRKPEREYTPDDWKHVSSFRHFCQYGIDCRYIKDPGHKSKFSHIMRTTACSDGYNCKKANSAKHRLLYKHERLMDFIVPCARGSHCHRISDPTHTKDYYHIGAEPENMRECYNVQWLKKNKIKFD